MISILRDVTNKQTHAHSCHLRLTGALHYISDVAIHVCALSCKFKFYRSDLTKQEGLCWLLRWTDSGCATVLFRKTYLLPVSRMMWNEWDNSFLHEVEMEITKYWHTETVCTTADANLQTIIMKWRGFSGLRSGIVDHAIILGYKAAITSNPFPIFRSVLIFKLQNVLLENFDPRKRTLGCLETGQH